MIKVSKQSEFELRANLANQTIEIKYFNNDIASDS